MVPSDSEVGLIWDQLVRRGWMVALLPYFTVGVFAYELGLTPWRIGAVAVTTANVVALLLLVVGLVNPTTRTMQGAAAVATLALVLRIWTLVAEYDGALTQAVAVYVSLALLAAGWATAAILYQRGHERSG